MTSNWAAILYLASGVLFILALRGLSSPETSRQGNTFGMLGMAIAVGVTLMLIGPDATTLAMIAGAIVIGGGIGAVTAQRIKMTAMPQLVAAFHSLVGLAAVAVAAAAFHAPQSFHIALPLGIAGPQGIKLQSLIELSVGCAIGAVTFTGSIIAFAKLNGNMSGAPIMLPARHAINIAIALAIVVMIYLMVQASGTVEWHFWAIARFVTQPAGAPTAQPPQEVIHRRYSGIEKQDQQRRALRLSPAVSTAALGSECGAAVFPRH